MPNWCSNRVTISGDEKDVQALKKAVKGYSNKFNKLFSFDAIRSEASTANEFETTVVLFN